MERGPGHTPPVPPRRAPVFVGRRQELTELLAGLEDALEGHGRLFLLAGEAGIGKSRLADELATTARELGAMVLWGRCWEAGGAPAYWPWVQSIRSGSPTLGYRTAVDHGFGSGRWGATVMRDPASSHESAWRTGWPSNVR
jgi:hypothetical protein